jgi:hypothetical protein
MGMKNLLYIAIFGAVLTLFSEVWSTVEVCDEFKKDFEQKHSSLSMIDKKKELINNVNIALYRIEHGTGTDNSGAFCAYNYLRELEGLPVELYENVDQEWLNREERHIFSQDRQDADLFDFIFCAAACSRITLIQALEKTLNSLKFSLPSSSKTDSQGDVSDYKELEKRAQQSEETEALMRKAMVIYNFLRETNNKAPVKHLGEIDLDWLNSMGSLRECFSVAGITWILRLVVFTLIYKGAATYLWPPTVNLLGTLIRENISSACIAAFYKVLEYANADGKLRLRELGNYFFRMAAEEEQLAAHAHTE